MPLDALHDIARPADVNANSILEEGVDPWRLAATDRFQIERLAGFELAENFWGASDRRGESSIHWGLTPPFMTGDASSAQAEGRGATPGRWMILI
jgi:hypothetical protein